jgi:ADP-ribosylglycohydrolase
MLGKVMNGILGFAVADAVGVPVEFKSREELKNDPVRDMIGFRTHNQPAGTWSDDTSMTLALLDSLTNELNYHDMMVKFSIWMNQGDYTPHGRVFDIGIATRNAIIRFSQGKKCFECGGSKEFDNGNGSLMRSLPIAYYIIGQYGYSCETEVIVNITHNISALTHGHIRSKIACVIYVLIAIELIRNKSLEDSIRIGIERAVQYYSENNEDEIQKYHRIQDRDFQNYSKVMISSSGYVVDTLEASLWCLLNSSSYKECVLTAVNLGDDTDTIAAIAGGLAGIAYGRKGIPDAWLKQLAKREYIEELCTKFTDSIYMGNVHLLLTFKEFMATETKNSCCKWEGGGKIGENTYTFAFPVYSDELRRFIDVAENTIFWSYDYMRILEKNHLKISHLLVEAISTADVELVGAILTAHIRQERFCDGLIASAVEDRVFYRIICRFEDLYMN